MYVRFSGTASAGAGSVLVPANGGAISMEDTNGFVDTGAMSLYCATTGKSFTCKEA